MKKLALTITLAAALWAGYYGPARAQICDTPFEVIITLKPPLFGFPSVWDTKYAIKDHMTQLGSGVAEEGGTIMTIGRTYSRDNYKTQDIVLAELNRRGRALKQESYPAKEAEYPVKMIKMGKDYVAISNMLGGRNNAEHWVRLAWYDRDGKYKHEKILKDATFDYDASTLVAAAETDGFVAVLHAINRNDRTDENGVLMRFTPQGEQLWRRAYRPGIPNELNGLTAVDKTGYIATGRIRLDDGRLAAWAMRIGYDGGVQWQRTYPRGSYSVFRAAAKTPSETTEGNGFIIAGDALPLDNGQRAAWVMEINALGEPQWQRYFRRDDYELTGNWIRTEKDGRRVLMMNAAAVPGQGGFDHIRMLTLSPRGGIIGDESYYTGLKAKATDFVDGWNGERIFTADVDIDVAAENKESQDQIVVVGLAADPEEQVPEAKKPERPITEGWVLVATALDPYNDPCKR